MNKINLTYGDKSFEEIKTFLNENYNEIYTLSIYDNLTEKEARIKCKFEDILPVVKQITNIEKDFPNWIWIDEISNSYVVGFNFTRGKIKTLTEYKYNNGNLEEIYLYSFSNKMP